MKNAEECTYYGIAACGSPEFTGFAKIEDPLSLYKPMSIEETDIPAFWAKVAPFFNEYIKDMHSQAKEKRS